MTIVWCLSVCLWRYRHFWIARFLYLSLGFVLTCLVYWLDLLLIVVLESVLCDVWRFYFTLHMRKMIWIIPRVEFQYRTKTPSSFFCVCVIYIYSNVIGIMPRLFVFTFTGPVLNSVSNFLKFRNFIAYLEEVTICQPKCTTRNINTDFLTSLALFFYFL